MTHKFKEYRFNPDGEFKGIKTVVQSWKCELCSATIDIPLGVSPNDYHNGECKGVKK